MPNHIGAFLRASECFAEIGVNITRVNYNKAVDSHTLFIDAEGTPEQLKRADEKLREIGYIQNSANEKSIVLLEFALKDEPGSVTGVLKLINSFNFNISYVSSQENGSEYQYFKMGLFVEDTKKISEFLAEAEKLCKVRVIDYNNSEKVYDNSIFYTSFARGLVRTLGLPEDSEEVLLVNANLAMQLLDEEGLSPYKTFDSISKFAELLARCRGAAFDPRISRHKITDNTEIILIEPACGSNTAIIKSGDECLFIDTGYAMYKEEMTYIFRKYIEGFDDMEKKVFVTHADLDHCGLLPMFDKVYASKKTAKCLELEYYKGEGYRAENKFHRPYIEICRTLTLHKGVEPSKVIAPFGSEEPNEAILTQIGFFDFGEMHFEVYEGKGGHVAGETILIDYEHRVAFTGDVYINMRGMIPAQAEYNKYAPILMTSVDTDPKLCALERQAILQRLGGGNWQIFGAHGYKKEFSVNMTEI